MRREIERYRVRAALAALLLTACFLTAPLVARAVPQRVKTRRIIVEVTKAHGFGAADQRAMLKLAERESGTSTTPHTGSYYGLFQIPILKHETHGPLKWIGRCGRWKNPRLNTADALRYIKRRYGTPRKALAHSYRCGWY